MLPLGSIGAAASVRLGACVDRRLKLPVVGLLLSTLGIIMSIGFFGFLIVRLLEPGAIFHPERRAAADDMLDDATRAILKWKVVVAVTTATSLVAMASRG